MPKNGVIVSLDQIRGRIILRTLQHKNFNVRLISRTYEIESVVREEPEAVFIFDLTDDFHDALQTLHRVVSCFPPERTLVLTADKHMHLLTQLGISKDNRLPRQIDPERIVSRFESLAACSTQDNRPPENGLFDDLLRLLNLQH